MQIRKAVPEDFNQVFALWGAPKKSKPDSDPDYNAMGSEKIRREWFRKRFRQLLKRPGFFFVAEDNGQIIGTIGGITSERPSLYVIKKEGALSMLMVEKSRRREGIASQLIRSSIMAFKRMKIPRVTLSVAADNRAAKKLYSKLGFEPCQATMIKSV